MCSFSDSNSDDERADNRTSEPTLNREGGSGSLNRVDAWSQSQHVGYEFANDGRSDTRTTLYWKPDDATPAYLRSRHRHQLHRDPSDRRSWSSLAKKNDGVGDPSRDADNFHADIKRWTQTFCNQLDLGTYIFERTHYIVDDMDISTFGKIPVEHIIIGIISLVVDSETSADIEDWSPDDWIIYRDDFQSLMDDVEMDTGTLWTVRKKVHQETDYFSED